MKRLVALLSVAIAAPVAGQSPVLHATLTCNAGAPITACRILRITDSTPTGGAVVFTGPADVAAGGPAWTTDFPCSPSVSIKATAWVVGVHDGTAAPDTVVVQSGIVTCQRYGAAPTVTFAVTLAPAGAPPPEPAARTGSPAPVRPDSLPPHPRVWLDPARLARLRRQAATNTIRWQRVMAAADAQVAKGSSYARGDYFLMPDLCLAYLGTGQQRYATRAGILIQHYAVDANNEQGDSGYPYRYDLPVVTMGLDWCYTGLTPGERHQAATWLMNRADWVWPETDSGGVMRYSVTHPADNYFWGFMQTGPAALAALGSDTATGAKSGTNRPAFHIALALHKWATIGKPYLDGPGHGGAYVEGTNYDQGWKIGAFADAFLTAGDTLSDPWFADAFLWHLEYVLPDGRHKIPFGAQTRISDAPLYTYDREHLFHLWALARPDPALAAAAQAELNLIGQVPVREIGSTTNLADELLYYDPARPAAPDLRALPLTFLSDSTGVFVSRTSWTDPDALVWFFQSGPADNDNYGSNQLDIWQGRSWITINAMVYSAAGEGFPSQTYNTLTVGDTGSQKLGPGPHYGAIVALQQAPDLVVIRGQADSAYGLANESVHLRPVKDYLRTVAYLPDLAAFVVLDQAAFVDATVPPVYRWQSAQPLAVTDTGFTLVNPSGDHRCTVSLLAPAVTVGDTAFYLNRGATPSSHAAVIRGKPHAVNRAVTVLQCGAAGFVGRPARVALAADQVTVWIGSVAVTLPFAPSRKVLRH